MDGIGDTQQFEVPAVLCLGGKLGGVLAIEIVKSLDRFVARPLSVGVKRLKHATADDFVSLVSGSGLPARLHATEYPFQSQERLHALRATGFRLALDQRAHDQNARHELGRLGQRLDKRQERLEAIVRELAGVEYQLVEQDYARAARLSSEMNSSDPGLVRASSASWTMSNPF